MSGDSLDLSDLLFAGEAPGIEDEEWRLSAVCAQVDPDVVFPAAQGPDVGSGEKARYTVAEARSVCRSCTVKRDCLTDALWVEQQLPSSWHDTWGMRGGIVQGHRRTAYMLAAREGRVVTIDDYPEVQNGE